MLNIHIIIYMLPLICKKKTVGITFCSFTSEVMIGAVAYQSAMKCHII